MAEAKGIKLSTEVVSLVHNIELHRSGWWEKSFEQIICATIWLLGAPQSLDSISTILTDTFRIYIDQDRLSALTEKLVLENRLLMHGENYLDLSESARTQIETNLTRTEDLESKVRQHLQESLSKFELDLDVTSFWKSFYQELLVPLVKELGARTYELFSGATIEINGNLYIEGFLGKYPTEMQETLRHAVYEFLSGKDKSVRAYILQLLNSVFILEASNLSTSSLEMIDGLLSERADFKVVVDTNLLFSMLGMDDISSSEAASYLLSLPNHLSDLLEVKFVVLPVTLEEATRKLVAERDSMKGIRITPNVSSAATRHGIGLSGIALKYFAVAQKTRYQLSPEEYFNPYINDLESIVKGKNIELLDVDIKKYKADERVVSEIGREEYDQANYAGARQKTHVSIEHDVVLWYYAFDQRTTGTTSLIGTHYWIATIDRRFVRNDAIRCQKINQSTPICIFPAVLIQMLQLWIPRSPELEEAVIGSLRPLLSAEFSTESERATIAILKSLSRFEDVADIPEASIADVLLNESLRGRLQSAENIEDEQQLAWVKDALIQEDKKVREQLAVAVQEKQTLSHEKEQALSELTVERQRTASLEMRVKTLEQDREAELDKKRTQRIRYQFFFRYWVLFPVGLAFLSVILTLLIEAITHLPYVNDVIYSRMVFSVFGLSIVAWLLFTARAGNNIPEVSNWQPFLHLQTVKRWLIGVILTGVFINAIWDFIKSILQLK